MDRRDDTDGRAFLPVNTGGVFLVKKAQFGLLLFRRLKRIHKTDALKGLILPSCFPVGVLDVHRGHVVRQKHDFVAVEFLRELVRQRGLRDPSHDVNDVVARAGEGDRKSVV